MRLQRDYFMRVLAGSNAAREISEDLVLRNRSVALLYFDPTGLTDSRCLPRGLFGKGLNNGVLEGFCGGRTAVRDWPAADR